MHQRDPTTPVTAIIRIPRGPAQFITVTAIHQQSDLIAIGRFYRLSSEQNPDLYIYSQKEHSTWDLAEDTSKPLWNNPCINIYLGTTPVDHLEQLQTYNINVTVHNRGSGDAVNASVTLTSSSFGLGLSWERPITINATIPVGESVEVGPFVWSPLFSNTATLNVSIFHPEEKTEDTNDNEGFECWHVFPVCSPGETTFDVGNPTDDQEYVTIDVKQEGDHEDVWSASIEDYNTNSLGPGDDTPATLLVDPPCNMEPNDERTFTAEVYIDDEMILGLEFTGYCPLVVRTWMVIGIIAVPFILIAICYILSRD
jgi:hypothetical protein